jgi:hypothetical protein
MNRTEINNENKAKFFAQHLISCEVFRKTELQSWLTIEELAFIEEWNIWDEVNLLLTPLSLISEEDAIEVDRMVGYMPTGIADWAFTNAADYLRSKGYALPWMGLSVDQLEAAGWIKLKTN